MDSTILEILSHLVAIDSRTGHERQILEFIEDKLLDSDFRVSRQNIDDEKEPRYNLLAKKGKGKFSVLFIAHVDTVEPDVEYINQEVNPLELRFDDEEGVYRGLGCADQKAGIAALLSAFDNFTPENVVLKTAFLVDEEADSKGAVKLIDSRQDFLKDVKLIISTDLGGTNFDLRYESPAVSYYAGNYGRLPIRITVKSSRQHGSIATNQPIIEGSKILMNVWKNRNNLLAKQIEYPDSSFSIRKIQSESSGFSSPDKVEILLDFTIGENSDSTSIINDIELMLLNLRQQNVLNISSSEYDIDVPDRGFPYFKAFIVDEKNKHVAQALECYQKFYKHAPGNRINRSVADSNAFATLMPNIPVITFGPTGGNAHNFTEWLHKDGVQSATEFYRYIIESFNKAE